MWNNFAIPTVETFTLVDLLRARAQSQPDQQAFAFLYQSEKAESQLTYRNLEQKVRAIGALLQQKGAAGKPVLLLHQPGLDYIAAFLGCLAAGAIAVPAYPPRSVRMVSRIHAIVMDTRAELLLTNSATLTDLQRYFVQVPDLKDREWIATDLLTPDLAEQWRMPALQKSTLAYLQYTSGSTATPKGVMVSHGNLLHNLELLSLYCVKKEQSYLVSWLPPYHDMGLISGILLPIYVGCSATLMSPVAFLQRPVRWLETISQTRATMSVGPNFAFDLCVRKTTPEQRAALDLSSWDMAGNGAEPVRAQTLQRFAEAFGPSGFRKEALYPCYGLAEATLMVATGTGTNFPATKSVLREALASHRVVVAQPDDQEAAALVGCELLPGEQQIVIVNPETLARCVAEEVGEIWVAGESVALGYWQNAVETERTFHSYIATGEGPFLRTGDLGFIQDGILYVTGRRKDVIIIRGRNHYPQDIELTVEQCHPAIRLACCAAFSIEVANQEQLVVLAEIDPHYQAIRGQEQVSPYRKALDVEALSKEIRKEIWEQHDLQPYQILLVKAGTIPKTSSGKIQRQMCCQNYLAGEITAWTGAEERKSRATDTAGVTQG